MGVECEKNHGQRPMHKEVFNAAFSDRIVLRSALAISSIGVVMGMYLTYYTVHI